MSCDEHIYAICLDDGTHQNQITVDALKALYEVIQILKTKLQCFVAPVPRN